MFLLFNNCNISIKIDLFSSYFYFTKMDIIQTMLENANVQSFWRYKSAIIDYKKALSRLKPFIRKIKQLIKDTLDPNKRNSEEEAAMDLSIKKIFRRYINEEINTEQFLKLLNIKCNDYQIGVLNNIIQDIYKKKHKYICEHLAFTKIILLNNYYNNKKD